MRKALIIIDAQKYFLNNKTKLIVKKIHKFLKKNLQNYDTFYFTIFKNNYKSPLWNISDWKDCTDSPDTDICDELKQFISKNNLIYKNILSAVKIPQIINEIKRNNIQEVHLCGFDTDSCILATAYDLFDLGIKPVVLENLTWSTSKERLQQPAIKMLNRNIGFVKKVKLI